MNIKVTLRQKSISKNRQSLYLDFYPAITHPETNLLTRREFLKMYVLQKPKTLFDKQHNKETLQMAEQIRQNRENTLNKPEIYTAFEREQLKIKEQGQKDFVSYFKALTDKRKASNFDNWSSAYQYLKTFTNGDLKFVNLTETFCNDFREYLLKTKLSNNSALSYFNKFKATLKQAYKDGFLINDLNTKIATIKPTETQRNFLAIEDLNSLAQTECKKPQIKASALFSALTGLRFSDIQKLVWSEITHIEGQGYFIQFTQQKTKNVENQPISKQAYDLLGTPKKANDKVFDVKYSAYENKILATWIKDAGITKKITFHCFRHTFATLQLNAGTDIYTVSKMLGHRELKTTQIYAKIIDKTKRDTTDKITITF